MRLFPALVFIFLLSLLTLAQTRTEAVTEFNELRARGATLESIIASPDERDFQAAKKGNLNVVRLLPRESYDKGLFETSGGDSYFSFYFRIPNWGHGVDIGLQGGELQAGHNGLGLLMDLGNVPIRGVSSESKDVSLLRDYAVPEYQNYYPDFDKLRSREGLKINDTAVHSKLSAQEGHTFLLRSIVYGYYDVVAAFSVQRKDADGSLILAWKLLDQLDTPLLSVTDRSSRKDSEILENTKRWQMFPNLNFEITEGVMTISGSVRRDQIAYVVQLATSAGARKVVNRADVK